MCYLKMAGLRDDVPPSRCTQVTAYDTTQETGVLHRLHDDDEKQHGGYLDIVS
jgi:hypothetical protein